MFVYEITAYEYDIAEHHILLHEKEFTAEEFKKLVETARERAKPDEDDFDAYLNSKYPADIVNVLADEFGFVKSDRPIVYVGYDFDDKCEIIKWSD